MDMAMKIVLLKPRQIKSIKNPSKFLETDGKESGYMMTTSMNILEYQSGISVQGNYHVSMTGLDGSSYSPI